MRCQLFRACVSVIQLCSIQAPGYMCSSHGGTLEKRSPERAPWAGRRMDSDYRGEVLVELKDFGRSDITREADFFRQKELLSAPLDSPQFLLPSMNGRFGAPVNPLFYRLRQVNKRGSHISGYPLSGSPVTKPTNNRPIFIEHRDMLYCQSGGFSIPLLRAASLRKS